MEITWGMFGFAVGLSMLMVLLYLLYRSDQRFSFLRDSTNKPLKHLTAVENKAELQMVLKLLPLLSVGEKELIFSKLFGRTIKIVKVMDERGESFFDIVAPGDTHEFGEEENIVG